jgi:V/A-type H+-transporting ATPase subunit D
MANVSLSKASLQEEREKLRLYERMLPSLDLKRMQLTGELRRAKREWAQAEEEMKRLVTRVGEELPMLANRDIGLSGLIEVTSLDVEEENVVGVKLPVLKTVHVKVVDYSLLDKPHWVDSYIERLQQLLHVKATVRVAEVRVQKLNQAVRRITQRVNLFEKILIPEARKNIKRIQIFLADMERAATVRSKIAKAMRVRDSRTLSDYEVQA